MIVRVIFLSIIDSDFNHFSGQTSLFFTAQFLFVRNKILRHIIIVVGIDEDGKKQLSTDSYAVFCFHDLYKQSKFSSTFIQ